MPNVQAEKKWYVVNFRETKRLRDEVQHANMERLIF